MFIQRYARMFIDVYKVRLTRLHREFVFFPVRAYFTTPLYRSSHAVRLVLVTKVYFS